MRRRHFLWFDVVNVIILGLISLVAIYPFWYILIYSVSNPQLAAKGIYLLPAGFTMKNFAVIFENPNIVNATVISVLRTAVGTVTTVVASALFAYCLANAKTPGRKIMYRMIFYSMYFNAGIIPWYLTLKTYGLKDNFLLYILPYAVSPFYLILFKAYFEQLPRELEESAFMDGAGFLRSFRSIILPVSLPIVATIALFSAVNQWNMWFDNFYLAQSKRLMTLQLLLLNYLTEYSANQSAVLANFDQTNRAGVRITPTSIRMAITTVAVLPVFCIYPFVQKYFVKGIMLGAIKG